MSQWRRGKRVLIFIVLLISLFIWILSMIRRHDISVPERVHVLERTGDYIVSWNQTYGLPDKFVAENKNVVTGVWIQIPGRPAYLFSAYYDSRDVNKNAIVRVLSLVHYKHWKEKLYCKKFYNKKGVCSGVAEPFLFNPEQYTREGRHFYWAVQYICQLDNLIVPDSVTLYVNDDCSDVQNYSIKVTNNIEPIPGYHKKTFGLCLSRLHNFNNPRQLFDAFENNRFFGVETVTVYRGKVSESTNELLQRYVDEGRADIVPFILPDKVASQIISNGQHLAINDCLYRNMNKVKYLVYTDTDELIIPRKHINWEEMIASLSSDDIGVYMFLNVFFLRGKTPKQMNPFQSWILRSTQIFPPKTRSKCIVEPNKLISVTIHYPVKFMPGYKTKVADDATALMHHYRREIPRRFRNKTVITEEYAVRKFAAIYNKTYQERLKHFEDILSKEQIP